MTRPEQTHAGGRPDPDLIRAEAERFVAAGLAAVSMAADRIGAPTRERGGAAAAGFDALGDMLFGPSGHRRHSVANDSPECCRCPVCRVIAAARQPSPTFAERLASGVGLVAEGAARVMRGVAEVTTATRPAPDPPPAPSTAPTAGWSEPAAPEPAWAEADPWAAATAEPPVSAESPVTAEPAAPAVAAAPPATPPAKRIAKKAVKKPAAKAAAKRAAATKPARPNERTGNPEQ